MGREGLDPQGVTDGQVAEQIETWTVLEGLGTEVQGGIRN